MSVLTGFFHTLILVLVVSGAEKLLRPSSAAAALRSAKMVPSLAAPVRTSLLLSRLLGITEIAIAAVALLLAERSFAERPLINELGGPLLVASAFIGFNLFISRLTAHDDGASCGCFGNASAPAGKAHRRFNGAAAAILIATGITSAVQGQTPTVQLLLDQGLAAILLYLVVVSTGVIMFILGPSLLAELAPQTQPAGPDQLFRITDRLTQ